MNIPDQIRTIRQYANGYKLSQVLNTAEELHLFDALSEGRRSLDVLAKGCDLPADRLACLLNALVANGVLETSNGEYWIAEEFDTLNPKHPASQNGYLRYAAFVSEQWRNLGNAVRGSEPASRTFSNITGRDKKSAMAFASAMDANAKVQAKFLASNFKFDGRKILDIGAGAGTYSIEVGTTYDTSSGVLMELPDMVPITRSFLERSELSDRYRVVGADYRNELAGDGYDDIFLFAVIHQGEEKEVSALLKRIHNALRPGGRLFLSSFFLDENRVSPLFSVMFAVEMLVIVPTGHVYTHSEIEKLLASSNFDGIQRLSGVPGPAGWYLASRPA